MDIITRYLRTRLHLDEEYISITVNNEEWTYTIWQWKLLSTKN